MPTDDRFLTVSEVAEHMRVSTMTVYRLIKSGDLAAARVGRSYRVRAQALEDYLDRGRTA
jgi:excisionase family DNA binding protein